MEHKFFPSAVSFDEISELLKVTAEGSVDACKRGVFACMHMCLFTFTSISQSTAESSNYL